MEWGIFRIKDIRFGGSTRIIDHVLSINRDELRSFLLEDKRLRDVKIELAHPGENVRIINVVDVIEPRVKMDEEKSYFPGSDPRKRGSFSSPLHLAGAIY